MSSEDFSLYLHIPFCRKICPYCDFNVHSRSNVPEQEYSQALIKELYLQKEHWLEKKLSTIYFGGGTPSLFSATSISLILQEIRKLFDCSNLQEITFEANPHDINTSKFSALHDLGITRLSIGAQSSNQKTLRLLGRDHVWSEVEEAVSILRKLNFNNINLDLIFAAPQQTAEELNEDLTNFLNLNPNHISTYNLTIEEGTEFYRRLKKGSLILPEEDLAAQMFGLIEERLSSHNYNHYEISNYALTDFESKHNLGTWHFGEFLGVGAGAHSTENKLNNEGTLISRRHFANITNPEKYISAISSSVKETSEMKAIAWNENLEKNQSITEFAMLSLRTSTGLNLKRFEELFKCNFLENRAEAISYLSEKGLLIVSEDSIKLSFRGRLLADSVSANLLLD